MNDPYLTTPIAQHIWDAKYRFRERGEVRDATIRDTWHRVAAAEKVPDYWQMRFYDSLRDFK